MDNEPITVESIMRLLDRQAKEFNERLEREAAARAAEHAKQLEFNAAFDWRWDKAEKRMKQLDERYGEVSKTLGQHAEQFFQRAVIRTYTFGGKKYEWMTPRLQTEQLNGLQDEFDIVLHNGSSVAVMEVKCRFRKSDLHTLISRKLPNFQKLCPQFAEGKTTYLGIAGFSFDDGVIEEARAAGIGALSKDGKNVTSDDENLKSY